MIHSIQGGQNTFLAAQPNPYLTLILQQEDIFIYDSGFVIII